MTVEIINGDCRDVLKTMDAESFDCVVTSPPYYGLRDYGVDGQIGLEPTINNYVQQLTLVGEDIWRVLKKEGSLWLNLGDSYASKQLRGMPWRVAFSLQSSGWILRSAIVWNKPNPMPESVTDRPTSAYEMVFLFTKSERYFYDADAVAEPSIYPDDDRKARSSPSQKRLPSSVVSGIRHGSATYPTRNARNVWTIAPKPFKGSHFATMPPDLAERCIKAGCPVGGRVLDPFGGAGTTGPVADRLGRHATLIELNPAYRDMADERIAGSAPLLATSVA